MNPLGEQLAKLLENAPEEWKKNSRAAAAAILSQLNVVSREEFDAHCELLSRTATRLEQMEKTIAKLEGEKKRPAAKNAAPAHPKKPSAARQTK